MSYTKITNEVKAAANPSAALLVVAAALDEAFSRIIDLEVGVSGWDEWSGEVPPLTDDWRPPENAEQELIDLKAQLQGCEDADESKALRASIELKEDELSPPPDFVDNTGDAARIDITNDDGDTIVDLPTPTEAQLEARRVLLPELGLHDQYGVEDGTQYSESFVKAGPLLLYYSDREYVNSLPEAVKRSLVEDVAISSPAEAHDMGRDLLKDMSAGTPELAVEAMNNALESGSIHNGA